MLRTRGRYYIIYWVCLICSPVGVWSECTGDGGASATPTPAYFYPFGTEAGDTTITTASNIIISAEQMLSKKFVYSNKQFSSFYVSVNGLVYLETPPTEATDPIQLPQDKALVAPYWKDIQLDNADWEVHYRKTTDAADLSKATSDLRLRFSTPIKFIAQAAVVVTWVNVTHALGDCNTTLSLFQTVLVTDGRYSFVIINYAALGGTDSGGDAPNPVAGLNSDSTHTFSLPESATDTVLNLLTSSNVATNGVWMFRVDTEPFTTVLCDNAGALSLSPPMASPQGGTEVRLSGPCLTSSMTLKAKVDGKDVTVTHQEPHFARLVVPALWKLGSVTLTLSTDDGANYGYSAMLFLGIDAAATPMVTRVSKESWDGNINGNLSVMWNSEVIRSQMVDIFFTSYKVDGTGAVEELVFPLAEEETNDGSASFEINGLPLVSNETLQLITFGSILIKSSTENSVGDDNGVRIYSDMHVAVWFVRLFITELGVRNRMESLTNTGSEKNYILPELWGTIKTILTVQARTMEGIKQEMKLNTMGNCPVWKGMLNTLGQMMCAGKASKVQVTRSAPCSVRQARKDAAWTEYSVRVQEMGCNYTVTKDCVIQTYPNMAGASQKACYNSKGLIMDSTTTTSNPISAHPDGYIHSDGTMVKKWAVDHYLQDVEPFMFCCVWSTNKCLVNYEVPRSTTNCNAYRSPGQGGGGGDPHFATFDNLKFTFNGIGEFVLTSHEDGFKVQARVQQRGTLQASQVTSMAMKSSDTEKLEVRASTASGLELLIAGSTQPLSGVSPLRFKGVICQLTFSSSKVTSVELAFLTGELVKVTEYDGALQYIILPLGTYKDALVGLLGDYDGDMSNEFRLRSGVPQNLSTPQAIHNHSLVWQTTMDESLFTYRTGETHLGFQDPDFEPVFPDPDMPTPDECGDDAFCAYDMNVTADLNFAVKTKQLFDELQLIKHDFDSGGNCTVLNVPHSGLSAAKTRVGTLISILCDDGLADNATGLRTVVITCLSTLQWNNTLISCVKIVASCDKIVCQNNGTCVVNNNNVVCICTGDFKGRYCEKSASDTKLIILIGGLIGGVLLIAIVGIVILICKTRPRSGDKYGDTFKDWENDSRYGIPVFRGTTMRHQQGRYGSSNYKGYQPYGGEKHHFGHGDTWHRHTDSRRRPANADRPSKYYSSREDPLPPSPYPHFGSVHGSENEDSIDQIYRGQMPSKYTDIHPLPDYDKPYSDHIDRGNRRTGGNRDGWRKDDYSSSHDQSMRGRKSTTGPPDPPAFNPNWVLKP